MSEGYSIKDEIEKLVDYLWEEEYRSYVEMLGDCGGETDDLESEAVIELAKNDMASRHVFCSVVRVRDFLEKNKSLDISGALAK